MPFNPGRVQVKWAINMVAALMAGCGQFLTRPVQLPDYSAFNRACTGGQAAFAPSQPQISAGQCSLNHKTMIAPVAVCGYKGGTSDCLNMTLKIGFLGNKVIFYDSVTENSGIVFEIGKTINLTTDPRQKSVWRPATRPGTSPAAFATASLNGDCLQLGFEFRLTNNSTGQLISLFGHSMAFRAPVCTNSCQVLDYFTYFDNGRPMDHADQRLANQSCRLQ